MSTADAALPDDHPTVVAFNKWFESNSGKNTAKWVVYPEHTKGSLWAAFCAGRESVTEKKP